MNKLNQTLTATELLVLAATADRMADEADQNPDDELQGLQDELRHRANLLRAKAQTTTRRRRFRAVKNDSVKIGAIALTPRGTWQAFLADADGNQKPLQPGSSNPEFSQPEHAREAVLSEYAHEQRRRARQAARPTLGQKLTLNGDEEAGTWVVVAVDETGVTLGHTFYEVNKDFTWEELPTVQTA